MAKKKLCIVTSSEMTIRAFWLNHLKLMTPTYDVTVVTHTNDSEFLKRYRLEVPVHSIEIQRSVSLVKDVMSLFKLILFFRSNHFDLVHSVTPKAGLLAMIAARLAGVKHRVHTFTGQVWVTKKGFKRLFFKFFDQMIAFNSTILLTDSQSQKAFIVQQKITQERDLHVLAHGSISGVDLNRFKPDSIKRNKIRQTLKIAENEIVFLFLGRLQKDKGIIDLAIAFSRISQQHPNVTLMLVGPDEGHLIETIKTICQAVLHRLKFVDFTDKPEDYMAAADVFCLPSYREGFGTVIVEAASVGLPAIGSRIYGITDAIVEGKSGELFRPGDIEDLTDKMVKLLVQNETRQTMGQFARERVETFFSANEVSSELIQFYERLFSEGSCQ